MVQAMAGGTVPVIADLPPMTEIVSHGVDGLVVPREDPGALAAAVRQLIVDADLCGRCSRAAAHRVEGELNQLAVLSRSARTFRIAVNSRKI